MKKTKVWLLSFLITSFVIVGFTHTSFFSKTTYAAQDGFKKNKTAALQWGDRHYSKWIKNLSQEESTALKGYTKSQYDEINTYLRRNNGKLTGSKLDEKIKNIDSALQKAPVPENIIVYRRVTDLQFEKEVNTLRPQNQEYQFGKRVNMDAFSEIKNKFYNKTFSNHSYMSTSLSQDPHESFAKHPILLKISLPKGIHAGFIDKLSGYDQVELLVQRGHLFKYTSFYIEKDPSGREYVAVDVQLIK
ncbi:ADP-ribosyltransferase [Bacillus cereus]|uniref:ADP-ribosyltransferase n=1 Tax=Bacillus cereus TaxID=1396 RepID=UPI00397FF6E7